MRKNASVQEWRKLYELAERYVDMRPWEILDNEEMVGVRFSPEDSAYFTIMGNGGMEYGFGMYIGEIALREMQLQIHDPDGDEYSLYMQNCIVMLMDSKKDVPSEQMKVIRDLGKDYGKGRSWIYFEDHSRGYMPYIPDKLGVLDTIRFLEKLIDAIQDIEKMKPRGLHIMGTAYMYDFTDSGWETSQVMWNKEAVGKRPYSVADEGIRASMAKWKRTKEVWEVDIFCMHSVVNDPKYDRPVFPHILMIIDHKSGMPIDQKVLMPEDDALMLCQYVGELMRRIGKPEKILVHGAVMKEILSVMGQVTGVPVETGYLKHLEVFKNDFQKSFDSMGPGGKNENSLFSCFGLSDEQIGSLLELAGADSEEELAEMLAKSLRGGFFPGDIESADEIIWQSPSGMRERLRLLGDFYECTYGSTGEDDDAEWDEEAACGIIDADWHDDWSTLLTQCKTDILKEMAASLGIAHTGKKKVQLASEVSILLKKNPGKIKKLLSDEEKALIKKLREMINKNDWEASEAFAHPKETVISLVEKGMADIRYGSDMDSLYLTLLVPKEMKGLHL